MSSRHTLLRSAHDLGAAAWFGGSLAGVISINGTASDARTTERTRYAADGWARWAPVSVAAIGAHLVGGLGLINANRGRLRGQRGAMANTIVKSALTLAAVGTTAYSGVLGAKVAAAGEGAGEGRYRAERRYSGRYRWGSAAAAHPAVGDAGADRCGDRPGSDAGRTAAAGGDPPRVRQEGHFRAPVADPLIPADIRDAGGPPAERRQRTSSAAFGRWSAADQLSEGGSVRGKAAARFRDAFTR